MPILVGDVIDKLKELADNSVHCCVTSPPYWGLRDYGNDGQIGLEPTPNSYIEKMVSVFHEVRRLLRDDGTLWLNIGDSYMSAKDTVPPPQTIGGQRDMPTTIPPNRMAQDGLKQKDLVGIPWMLAFALRSNGWYLRQDIIWAKPNPMPESVRDRCTKSHEYIFLLSKSQKYYYDAEAIKEPSAYYGKDKRSGKGNIRYQGKRTEGEPEKNGQQSFVTINETRNMRDIWTINTKPFKGAHFATFPEELPRRCILAGTSEKGCCPTCGAGWVRQTERVSTGKSYSTGKSAEKNNAGLATGFSGYDDGSSCASFKTIGWKQGCSCPPQEPIPATVLDPFGGAGTTGLVARKLGRKYIMIELNPTYAQMASERIGEILL